MRNEIVAISLGFALGLASTYVVDARESNETLQWRQCAPAQDGWELVSSVQYEDKTECFYQKQNRIQRHTVPRKELI